MGYKVGVIGGDGIGPEVVAEALKVVRAVGVDLDTVDYDLGGARYLRTGEVLSDAVLTELRSFDAIFLGAVGSPDVPPGTRVSPIGGPRGPLRMASQARMASRSASSRTCPSRT